MHQPSQQVCHLAFGDTIPTGLVEMFRVIYRFNFFEYFMKQGLVYLKQIHLIIIVRIFLYFPIFLDIL